MQNVQPFSKNLASMTSEAAEAGLGRPINLGGPPKSAKQNGQPALQQYLGLNGLRGRRGRPHIAKTLVTMIFNLLALVCVMLFLNLVSDN